MAEKVIYASDVVEKFQYAYDKEWGYIWGAAGMIWTEEQQKAATRKQTIEYGSRWIGHHVADCSGLFSWAFKQLGGYMYHGSNTMWAKYTVSSGKLKNGKRTDGGDLMPGTAVFTDHEGDKTHVGLYVGGGYVIEAAGTQQGVIKSKVTNAKWTHWGVLKGVIMNMTEKPGEGQKPAEARPTLRKGSAGDYVSLMQTMLVNRGYSLGSVDGIFGAKTDAAVRAFQKANGLTADGICGPATWAELDRVPEASGTAYTVIISGLTKDQVSALLKDYPEADVKEERSENNA